MKRNLLITVCIALFFIILGGLDPLPAQDHLGFYTISGTVKDSKTKKKLEHVNVAAVGTNIGTITNADGEFTLKLDVNSRVSEIQLSCIGYFNAQFPISKNNVQGQIFLINPQSFQLSEVDVYSWKNPRDLIEAALNKIDKNYTSKPSLLTGFYRETIQKGRKYIDISEAVIHAYKSPYNLNADHDRTQVLKGRKLVSSKKSDTLSVKFLGGPNLSVYMDVVKNPDLILEREALGFYTYRFGEAITINERIQYVVHFEPQASLLYPLYSGTFYIDRETLAFTRAEFSMDMSDKSKVTGIILKEKPAGLRFTPVEVSYIVNYKQQQGKTYLNYIRSNIEFKCDWKRRLFATNYTIIGETIITDIQEEQVAKISTKDAFSMNKSLSHEVSAYFDDNFWGAYNIIEPTESLENAVDKLKKQQKNSQ